MNRAMRAAAALSVRARELAAALQLWAPCSRRLAARRRAKARARFWSEVRAGQREAQARLEC
jgi:hypothetical protein